MKTPILIITLVFLNFTLKSQEQISVQTTNPTFAEMCKDGIIDLNISGGFAPYDVKWFEMIDNSQNPYVLIQENYEINGEGDGEDIYQLSPGTYLVEVYDAICGLATLEVDLSCECPPNCFIEASVTNASCGGGGAINTSFDCEPEELVKYNWDDFNSPNTPDRSNLAPGEYCLTVSLYKPGILSCPYTECWTIEESNNSASINLIGLDNISLCKGGEGAWPCDGTLTIDVQPSNMNFIWLNIPNISESTSSHVTDLCAGNYTVVAQVGDCILTETFTIGCCKILQNIDLEGDYDGPVEIISRIIFSSTNNSMDGAIYLNPQGGTGNYVYSWTGPGGFQSNSRNITELNPGEYCVTISDGCNEYMECYIVENCEDQDIKIESIAEPTCEGKKAGIVTLQGSNGVEPYTYQITHVQSGETRDASQFGVYRGLQEGLFLVTMRDFAGCGTSSEFYIETGLEIIPQTEIVNTCIGISVGEINITEVQGGSPPYTYIWSHDSNLIGPKASRLKAGNYSVEIIETFGCSSTYEYTIIEEEPDISISNVEIEHTCPGYDYGSISIIATGGYPGFTYRWSHGVAGRTISGLGSGNYTVEITDSKGCSIEQTYIIEDSTPLEYEDISSRTDCYDETFCNGNSIPELAISHFDDSYYDPSDCKYYILQCSDGLPYYDLLGRSRIETVTNEAFNDEECYKYEECENGEERPNSQISGDVTTEHYHGSLGDQCYYCVDVEICNIDGRVRIISQDIENKAVAKEIAGTDGCDDIADNCQVQFQCESGTLIGDPVCINCLNVGESLENLLCDDDQIRQVIELDFIPDEDNELKVRSNFEFAKSTSEYPGIQLVAYPNPFRQSFTLKMTSNSSKKVRIKLLSIMGNLILSELHQLKSGDTTISSLNGNKINLMPGIYYVVVSDLNGDYISSTKVIKHD